METPVALITGSGRRLGRKIASALAQSGFDIVINYNESRSGASHCRAEIENMGRRCITVKADIRDSLAVKNLVRQTVKTFGKIDLLVNNAAIFPPNCDFTKISEKSWDAVIDTNLKATFLCSQEAAKRMLKQKSGRIVNIASLGGLQAWTKHTAYSVSKAGVVMLTRIMAKALAPNILVNAIAPGTIIIPNEESGYRHFPNVEKIPLKKYGKPSDITDLIVFLATKSDYITGQIFSADGGTSIS
jgi:3-oxoacyl-[acyl-carrier protein] reductase